MGVTSYDTALITLDTRVGGHHGGGDVVCEFTGDGIGRTTLLTRYYNTPLKNAALAFSVLAVVVSLCGLGFVLYFRNRPILRMSQRWFLVGYCLGWIGLAVAILLYCLPQPVTTTFCVSFHAMINLSLTFILLVMICKEYRAFILDKKTQKMRSVRFRKKLETITIAAIMGFAVLMDVLWFTLDTPQPDLCALMMCTGSPYGKVVWGVLSLLSLICIVLSVKAFTVSSVASDSKGILATIIFVVLGMSITGIIVYTTNISSGGIKFTVAFTSFATVVFAVTAVIFRKAQFLKLDSEEVKELFINRSNSLKSKSSSASGSSLESKTSQTKTQFRTTSNPAQDELELDFPQHVTVV